MFEVTAETAGGIRTTATDGANTLVMDEPAKLGGTNEGLSPLRTLAAALAGCTAMTLKLYSARKQWPLEDVKVTVTIDQALRAEPGAPNRYIQYVELIGPLDEAQRERLRVIAGKCPVHKLLEGPGVFEEILVEAAAGS